VIGVGDTTLAVLTALTQLTYTCPWAIPCLTLPPTEEPVEPFFPLLTELRDRLVVVNCAQRFRPKRDVRKVVRCVANRPLPTPTSLALWATQRLGHPELQLPLRSQFEDALDSTRAREGPSVATYSRLFSRYGPYTARDWRAIARLCWHAQAGTLGDDDRQRARLPMRMASRYATKYLHLPYHAIGERLGWEWVLEAALRTAGYV
jgi:hypothetical protein